MESQAGGLLVAPHRLRPASDAGPVALLLDMQSAFLHVIVLPPPSPRTRVGVRTHRARAGLAADAHVALTMQLVVGHLERTDRVPDLVRSHADQRVELVQWAALAAHYEELKGRHLRQLFAEDPGRGGRLTAEAAGVFLDYSKNRITDEESQEFLTALDDY